MPIRQNPTHRAAIDRALAWARERYRWRRCRRVLRWMFGMSASVVLCTALFSRWDTGRLIWLALAALGVSAVIGVVAMVSTRPPRRRLARLADRAFGLEDRLLTAIDPRTGERFGDVLGAELDARVEAEETIASGALAGRRRRGPIARWFRRWRLLVLIAALIALILGVHGVWGPGFDPRPGTPGEGERNEVAQKTGTIPLLLTLDHPNAKPAAVGPVKASLSVAADDTDAPVATLSVRTEAGDVIDIDGEVRPGRTMDLDLASMRATAKPNKDGFIECFIVGRGADDRPAKSNVVRIPAPPGHGGSSGGGKNKKNPGANAPKTKPDESGNKQPAPDQLPGFGPEERTPVVEVPFAVVPLLDENGRIIEGARITLEHAPGEPRPRADSRRAADARRRDLVEAYRQQAERVMERRQVPEAWRAIYRRYLEALER